MEIIARPKNPQNPTTMIHRVNYVVKREMGHAVTIHYYGKDNFRLERNFNEYVYHDYAYRVGITFLWR